MRITCIGTGSSGNCFYVESAKGTGIFLDAGMPPRAILDLGLSIVGKKFFVTHEHGDHAKYASELRNRYGAIIYSTMGTHEALGRVGYPLLPHYPTSTYCKTIPVLHNAVEPCAFYLELDDEIVLYVMDAGQIPEVKHLRPDVLIVEANYTQKRMEESAAVSDGGLFVSGRVSSGFGHLSVNQAVALALPMFPTLELLIFAHVSKNNFDIHEYMQDSTIPRPIKDKAIFARAGETYDTIPF